MTESGSLEMKEGEEEKKMMMEWLMGRTKIGVYSGGYWYLDYDGNYLWQYPATDKIWALGWAGRVARSLAPIWRPWWSPPLRIISERGD